jgi:hypothetical protein
MNLINFISGLFHPNFGYDVKNKIQNNTNYDHTGKRCIKGEIVFFDVNVARQLTEPRKPIAENPSENTGNHKD